MGIIGLSLANLRQRRFRTAAGVLSTALACALLSLSYSAVLRVKSVLAGFDEHSVIALRAPGTQFTQASLATVRSAAPGAAVEWTLIREAQAPDKSFGYEIYASSDDYFTGYPSSVLDPRDGARERWIADRQGVMVSADLIRRLGWKVGDTVTMMSETGPIEAHVSGITGGAVSFAVIAHYDRIDLASPTKGLVTIMVAHHTNDTDTTMRNIGAQLVAAGQPALVMRERSMHERIVALSGLLPALLEKIGLVFGLSMLFVILSNAFVSLRERRSEIGTLLAIGFTRTRMLTLVMCEFLATCIIAGLIGCGVPYALYHDHGLHLGEMALADVPMSGFVCAAVLAGAAALGTLVTLIPAVLLLRTRTVDLLQAQ